MISRKDLTEAVPGSADDAVVLVRCMLEDRHRCSRQSPYSFLLYVTDIDKRIGLCPSHHRKGPGQFGQPEDAWTGESILDLGAHVWHRRFQFMVGAARAAFHLSGRSSSKRFLG